MSTNDYDDTVRDYEAYKKARDERSSPTGFQLISLADLLAQPDPIYSSLVQDMLPAGGTSIIVAKPKVGKSSLAQQLTRCVAGGAAFLGRDVQQSSVIYLAFEEKDSEVKKSYRLAASRPDLPIFFHFGEPPEHQLDALRALIGDYAPGLVVIDTLAYWMKVADFNDYSQVGNALRPLHTLAREVNTHIMCVHHAGKGSNSGPGIDSPLGSTALTGNVDTIMVLNEGEGEARVLETRQRYGDAFPKTVLAFDKETRTFGVEGSVADVARRTLEEEIVAVVQRRTMTETDMRAALGGVNKNKLYATINTMVENVILVRTGDGKRNSPYMYQLHPSYGEDTFTV